MRNISIVWIFFAALCMAGCNGEDVLVAPVDIINVSDDGSYSPVASVDLVIDDKKVGALRLSFSNDTLEVAVFPDPESSFYVRSIRYHIATSLNSIPQVNGNPDLEKFVFTENTRKILLSALTGSAGFKGRLYIAAYARLAHGNPFPSGKGEALVRRTHRLGDPSYFATTLAVPGRPDSEYYGYCLQGDQHMDTEPLHLVDILPAISADTAMLKSVVDNHRNLDLVNWVLNQKRSSWIRSDNNPATGADIQMAVWKLIERTGNPTGTYIEGKFDPNVVNKIVRDAYLKGDGFRPICGQKELIILHKGPVGYINDRGTYNTGAYADPDYQVSGIVRTIECSNDERDCWGRGRSFPGKTGSYFGFEVR